MKPRRARTARQASSKLADFLLEIGTEELPYQFVAPALHTLGETTGRLLKEHRLDSGRVTTFGTPRRLAVMVEGLPERQASVSREVIGPSKAVAYDAAGQPTKAAMGFATSQGLAVEDLEIRQTAKGEYLFAVKKDAGQATPTVLANLLPGLVAGIPFPKAMRWNDSGMRFARPIRWLLALYAGKVVKASIGGVTTGARSYGHRFLSPSGNATTVAGSHQRSFPIKDARTYASQLERHGVIPDADRRRKLILEQLMTLAKTAGGQVHRDDELLEQAVYTVEYPQAIVGDFDQAYLTLPREILMMAMKEHQGYFSLLRPDGSLLPRFISVTNMKLRNMRLIREGNERVLAARLADAKFYFDEDRKVRLGDRVEKLTGVTFHQKLGTLHQKVQRVSTLVDHIASQLRLSGDEHRNAHRAAELSKADLLTGVVGEFPALQGIMGGEYARHDGEPDAVARAIAEQYLPKGMEGDLPPSMPGKILSLADRLDTVTAFFHVGIIPSGSEDPLGLRRHAGAIVRLLIEGTLRLNIGTIIDHADKQVTDQGINAVTREVRKQLVEFLFERVRYYGRTVHTLRDDVMEAVLRPSMDGAGGLPDLISKMKALQALTTRPEFDPLIVGFKRAHRLIEKEKWDREQIDAALFQDPSEGALQAALQEAGRTMREALGRHDYRAALDALVGLKPAIDAFFVGVMVNAEDPALRANRLSLLYAVDRLFFSFADFSEIKVAGA